MTTGLLVCSHVKWAGRATDDLECTLVQESSLLGCEWTKVSLQFVLYNENVRSFCEGYAGIIH